jgi:hypothetical protein
MLCSHPCCWIAACSLVLLSTSSSSCRPLLLLPQWLRCVISLPHRPVAGTGTGERSKEPLLWLLLVLVAPLLLGHHYQAKMRTYTRTLNPKPQIHDRSYCHDTKKHVSSKTAAKDTTRHVSSLVYVVHWSLISKILVDQSSRKLWRTTKLQNPRVKHRLELDLNSSILLPLLGADIFFVLNTYMKASPEQHKTHHKLKKESCSSVRSSSQP